MADFDAFEDTPSQQFDVDPAAAFLAREQDELKGLEDDAFGTRNTADDGDDLFGQPMRGSMPLTDDFSGADGGQGGDAYSAISQVDRHRAEPEKLRVWREEHALRIAKNDEEEKKCINEWKEIAKKELDDWYRHHDEQMAKTKDINRESEARFVDDRDKTEPGEEWEKICRLCEFNPKGSKNTKDVSRLRSVLLQLKQTPLVR